MRILLLVPTFNYKQSPQTCLSISDFPSGLAYIAAALKKAGHEVIGLNLNNDARFETNYMMLVNKLTSTLETEKPDLIGLGGLCIDYAFLKDAMSIIRRQGDIPVVMGGGIISHDRDFIFNLLKPDYCIWGEGEEVIVKLVNRMEETTPLGETEVMFLEDIGNLGYRDEWGNARFNKTNYDYGNIDDRAFPDFEPFGAQGMIDDYSMATRLLYRYQRPYPRPMIITTARSCPFSCTFCVHSGGPKYRARSISNIMAEIKELYEKYQFNILVIGDELFAASKKRFDSFCNVLLKNKEKYGWDFDWLFQTHANSRLDLASLKLAKKGGCFTFSYGLESASQEILDSMKKHTKVQQYVDTIEMAKEAGIGFGGNLMIGDPAETEFTIHKTLEFWAKHGQQSHVFLVQVVPYPGSEMFDYCVEIGLIQDKEKYYETLGDVMYNMTQMPIATYAKWVNFMAMLDRSWLAVNSTKATQIIEEPETDTALLNDGHRAYQIYANCPYCEADVIYREIWNSSNTNMQFMGVGCQSCGKKIRIDLMGVV